MKAIYGKNWNEFTARITAVAGFSENVKLSGDLYKGTNHELALVIDDHSEITDPRGQAHLIDIEKTANSVMLPDNSRFEVECSSKISSIADLALQCTRINVEPVGSWVEDIICAFADEKSLNAVVEMMLIRGCMRLSCAIVDHADIRYLLRVQDASIYVILHCIGEKVGNVYYCSRNGKELLPWYIPWGTDYPLLRFLQLPADDDNRLTIISPDFQPFSIPKSDFKNISTLINARFVTETASIDSAAASSFRIPIEVKLIKADPISARTLPAAELWIIPPSCVDLFSRDLYCPESALQGFDGCAFMLEGSGPFIALWSGGTTMAEKTASMASLVSADVQAFYRCSYEQLPLYIPDGFMLRPLLEQQTLQNLFQVNSGIFSILCRSENGNKIVCLNVNDFRPVRKALVDYHFSANRELVERLYSAPLYNFGKPAVYEIPEPVDNTAGNDFSEDSSVNDENNGSSGSIAVSDPTVESKQASPKLSPAKPHPEPQFDKQASPLQPPPLKPKTPDELLMERVQEYISRYDSLTKDDWRRYMSLSSRTKQFKADSYSALASMLFVDSPDKWILSNICEAIGKESDWFYTKSPKKLLSEIFNPKTGKLSLEDTLFHLCAYSSRFFSAQAEVLDGDIRAKIAELKSGILASGNAKYVWLFSRISHALTRDKQTLDEGRIEIQNLLADNKVDCCIPRSILSVLEKNPVRMNEIRQFEQQKIRGIILKACEGDIV
jgi:hypothetical protein